MKIKYWSTLAAALFLSLGLITSCATPEGGTGGDAAPGGAEPETAPAPAEGQ
jgi:hypothetical protein